MSSKVRPPDVEEAVAIMQAAPARGRGRRSPLYLWFADNHAALVLAFERSSPRWADLAKYLGERGLRDADGKPPTTRGTRDAWYRVGKDKQAAETKAAAKPVPVVRAVQPAAVLEPGQKSAVPQIQSAASDVQDILGRLGGTRARGGRLPNSVG